MTQHKQDQRKISDILWEAANVHLRDPNGKIGDMHTEVYSCNAIRRAITNGRTPYSSGLNASEAKMNEQIVQGLKNMGLELDAGGYCNGFTYRSEHSKGKLEYYDCVQSARYAWLMFAHQIALEQGV